jgi:hypothetical protein
MYKVPLHILEGFLNSLEQSNAVLKKLAERDDSLAIQESIRENEKQINIIKLNYTFAYEHKG